MKSFLTSSAWGALSLRFSFLLSYSCCSEGLFCLVWFNRCTREKKHTHSQHCSDLCCANSHNCEAGVSNFGNATFFALDLRKTRTSAILKNKRDRDRAGSEGRSTFMVDGWKMMSLLTNTQQENGCTVLSVWSCVCSCVGGVLFMTLLVKAVFVDVIRRKHSPLLDQKDGYKHQQYKDENTSTDPSDLHHPVRLLGRIRDDFWLLCGTYNMVTIKQHQYCRYCGNYWLFFSVMSGPRSCFNPIRTVNQTFF